MAETTTPRLGLSVYSSGNDLHPDREKFNAQQRLLDAILATAQQGTLAARPAAGIGGSLYWATDNSRLYYDDGAAWRDVNTTGGGGSGAPISVGGTATEGTSARAARADHTHVLPLATSTAPGALSAADKKKLDSATPSATPNTLMMTDANGRSQTATPVNDADAVNKAYVDQTAANASNLTNGTVPLGRLPVVTSAVNGIMLAADKAKLDAASTSGTGNIVMRNASGATNLDTLYLASAPTAVTSATRKDYVDAQVATRAASSHSHDVATANAAGYMSAADKAKLDGATASATANTLVMNDASGRFSVATPTAASHAANKGYVDGKTWDGSDITTGTINQARIANATSALNGLMSSTDKAKLDAATAQSTGGTIPLRDSNGNIRFGVVLVDSAQSSYGHSLARKDYVDAQVGTRATSSHSHTASDIGSGVLSVARLPEATQSARGTLSAADKKKLDSATASATANTLVMNDASGRFSVATPTAASHAANKSYVDGLIAKQVTLGGDLSTTDLNTVVTPGDYYASSGSNATIANNYPFNGAVGTLSVRRFHASSIWVTQVLTIWNRNDIWVRSANSLTGWTDWSLKASDSTLQAGLKGKSDTGHKHSGSDITSGTISPLRIANATSSLDGLMSKADKAKLDGAAYHPKGASVVMSSSAGFIKGMALFVDENTPQQTQAHAVTRKDYVDGKLADIFVGTEIPDSANLNNYTTPGVYHNSTNVSVGTGSNYPSTIAGKLEVTKSASGSMVYQLWTNYSSSGTMYFRTKYGSSWYAWKEIANNLNVNRLVNSSLSSVPGSGSWDSYKTPGVYEVEPGGYSGNFHSGGILEVYEGSSGKIIQRRTLQGTNLNGGSMASATTSLRIWNGTKWNITWQ